MNQDSNVAPAGDVIAPGVTPMTGEDVAAVAADKAKDVLVGVAGESAEGEAVIKDAYGNVKTPEELKKMAADKAALAARDLRVYMSGGTRATLPDTVDTHTPTDVTAENMAPAGSLGGIAVSGVGEAQTVPQDSAEATDLEMKTSKFNEVPSAVVNERTSTNLDLSNATQSPGIGNAPTSTTTMPRPMLTPTTTPSTMTPPTTSPTSTRG
jgi:hypothetical protein